MMYGNVEAGGSDRKGAVLQAITFAAYITSLTILAILAVNIWYFVIIAVAGLPATGVIQTVQQLLQERRWQRNAEKLEQLAEPIRAESITTPDGLPMIKL